VTGYSSQLAAQVRRQALESRASVRAEDDQCHDMQVIFVPGMQAEMALP
jgi:hypothetical protein